MSKGSKQFQNPPESKPDAEDSTVAGQHPVLATLNDAGNADRFDRKWHPLVRFVPEWKKWFVWTGSRWRVDSARTIVEASKVTAREIYLEAAAISDAEVQEKIAKHALASQQKSRLTAMVALASSMPPLVVHVADLDKDPMLLGVQNGVIDLNTGRLRSAKQEIT